MGESKTKKPPGVPGESEIKMSLEKITAAYASARLKYAFSRAGKVAEKTYITRRADYFAALAAAYGVTVADVARIARTLGPVDDLDALPGTLAQLATFGK